MTDVGAQTIDAARAGRFVARTLAVLGGVVVAWFAVEATASADTAAIDVPSGFDVPTTIGDVDQARLWGESQASPLTREISDDVSAVVGRVAGPSDDLAEILKPAMGVVTATTERVPKTPFDIVILRQPSEAARGPVLASPLDSGVPASVPAATSSVSFDATEPAGSPCRYETVVDHPSPVTSPPPSDRDASTPNPPWSPMSACGTATSAATASGGDHQGGTVLPGRVAWDIPFSAGYRDFEHQAVRAVSIRPGVTPG
ncbi:hypothetical protein ACFQ05_14355 [Amycolatopsis umgeniensis]|uniref:Uncharacterized protein n=1 Tax=Amycolatopsis umgeniensis TaxID=336628 RepID=A0A841B599_9PSEU|nr:hypothetical protein [Amycolatopsis umgeniensis]MBB5854487.1 hypothetical protein [Amycolatopsis umgeniensis]